MRTAGYQALIPAPNGARNPRPRQRQNPGPGPKGRKRSCVKAEDRRECARSCHGAQIRSGASSGRFQAAMCGTIASSHFPISFCNSRCVSCLFSCLRIGVLVFFFGSGFLVSLSLSLSLLAVSFSQQPFCMYVACLFFISFTFVLLLILFCEIFVAVFRFPSLSCSFFPSFFPVGTGRLMAAPSPLLLDLAVCWMLLLSC
jgi:hypothetical protein